MPRSEAVLVLRLSTFMLVLTSVILLAIASQCTWATLDGAIVTATYPPFVFLAGFDLALAMLELVAIFLHLSKLGGGGDHRSRILEAHIDGAVQLLLYASTVVTFIGACTFRRRMSAWVGSGEMAYASKLGLSMAASFAVGHAAVVKRCALYYV